MNIATVTQLAANGKYEEALAAVDSMVSSNPQCACLLVHKARLIMVQPSTAGPSLSEAEMCLLRARELDSECLEAIEELAHFYDAVLPNKEKAAHFASIFIADVSPRLSRMKEIVDEAVGF
jgi:hypothetical protein